MRYNDENLQVKNLTRKNIDQIVEFLEEVKELELGDDEVEEIKDILIEGYSFGVFFENDLYSVTLIYEVSFDGMQILFDEQPNSLSAEPHLDYSFKNPAELEGVVFRAIDKIVKDNEYNYAVIQLSKTIREINDNPGDIVRAMIRHGYRFIESPDNITIAYKEIY